MQLARTNALVTGASGGLGRAIARALHARGATVALSARREDALEELRAELGGDTSVLPADLADADAAARLADAAGPVGVLVANAALPASGTYDDFTPEQIDRAIDVNLRAPIQLARALAPAMAERGEGHIVFVSSLSGKVASAGGSIYSATKFGLRGFASGLREDLHGTGVGVTTVFPGFIRDEGMFADAGAKLPPGVGTNTAGEVGDAVVRGIERNRAEIDVAPLTLRVGMVAAALAPELSARVQRRLGGDKVAEQLAEAQRDKR